MKLTKFANWNSLFFCNGFLDCAFVLLYIQMKTTIFLNSNVATFKIRSTQVNKHNYIIFLNFIYFWLCWVFVNALGLSLVAVSGDYSLCGERASHCSGFSLRSMGSRHAGFSKTQA